MRTIPRLILTLSVLATSVFSLFAQVEATRLRYFAGGKATGGGGGGSAMTNGVVAHWEMKADTSANEVDEMGASDLVVSASDTIPSTNFWASHGRDWEDGEDDYMSVADNADLSMSADASFTILMALRFESTGVTRGILNKGTAADASSEYNIYFNNSGSTLAFSIGNGTTFTNLTTSRSYNTGTNYFLGAIYNSTNDTMQLLICEPAGNFLLERTYTHGSQDSGASLYIGSFAYNTALNWDGGISEVTIAKRAFTTNEVITLYNSGNGRSWPWTGL